MAKYDYTAPKAVIRGINKKKNEGYFVQRLNDKKILAQYYEIVLKDKKKAEALYEEIKQDLQNPLLKTPKGTNRDMANFLRNLQNKETGSFVEYPTIFQLEIERAKHILRIMNNAGLKPKYPLTFLDKVNTGEKFKKYFKSLLLDFSKDNGDELNLAVTGLASIKRFGFYPFSKDWEKIYYNCLEMWQDSKTGYWGSWIKKKNIIKKLPELSTTFHILRLYYNKDTLKLRNPKYDMKHKRKMIETTWKIRNKNYPCGWLEKGHWSTHHNWDVTEILLYLFNEMNFTEKNKVRKLFDKFLKWNLNKNLKSNGGFIGHYPNVKTPNMYSTRFAILVLRTIGYFSEFYRERIWSYKELPINSYRIYSGLPPKKEFDTTRLKSIIYTKKTTYDPLHTRFKIFEYWQKNKSKDPREKIDIDSILELEKYPPKNVKIETLKKLPNLKKDQILVPVDRYGGKCAL